MKSKFIFTGIAVVALFALTFIGCGGADQNQSEAQDMHAESQAPHNETHAMPTKAEAYPLDYCIVSGEELGEMGDPVEYDYQGRTIKFCCKNCVKKFKADPDYYIAKLDSAVAGNLDMHESMHNEGDDHADHDHAGH